MAAVCLSTQDSRWRLSTKADIWSTGSFHFLQKTSQTLIHSPSLYTLMSHTKENKLKEFMESIDRKEIF